MPARAIYTLGHSNRPFDALVAMLRAHGVQKFVDVRTIPKSRHNPQFNKDTLGPALRRRRIQYRHMKSLGGLRRPRPDSPNKGWRNASFRGYADYMLTPEFSAALKDLMAQARKKRTVIVCAEAVPWRCHRSLIADALTVRKRKVLHIMSETSARPHALTRFAQARGATITYPIDPRSR